MKTVLEALKSYFQNTSVEQISKDWAETEKYDAVGPKIDEFLYQSRVFYETENQISHWEFSCKNEILENPKFASDFFLY
ncbi:hypothetical protein JSO61_006985 [Riemerella anatipestifer]|uniref:hypothetical protein n=1 Tax=Riemerella anatipestifer TaxID=34085 RepID=UPI002A86DAFC|nr:hypothetical protein [Riemerella anatipestifer]